MREGVFDAGRCSFVTMGWRARARDVGRIRPDGFVLCLTGTIIAATVLPCDGLSARLFSVASRRSRSGLLFLLQGARLSREAIVNGITHWRLHLIVGSTTFVCFPLIGLTLNASIRSILPGSPRLDVLFVCWRYRPPVLIFHRADLHRQGERMAERSARPRCPAWPPTSSSPTAVRRDVCKLHTGAMFDTGDLADYSAIVGAIRHRRPAHNTGHGSASGRREISAMLIRNAAQEIQCSWSILTTFSAPVLPGDITSNHRWRRCVSPQGYRMPVIARADCWSPVMPGSRH